MMPHGTPKGCSMQWQCRAADELLAEEGEK